MTRFGTTRKGGPRPPFFASARRALIALAVLAPPALGAVAEAPEAVRRMAGAGAVELALTRIEAMQPREATSPGWAEWEGLRCEVLARLGRRDALLARVKALPSESHTASLNPCLAEAARATLAQNEPAIARAHAAKLIWQANATSEEAKAARLTVIESYVAERRGDDAFRSMLRYQQDYQPLERATAERFAEAMLDLNLDREALNWLSASDEVSAARLRLQLRGATMAPEAVVTQARAAYARNADPAYWRAIHEAALRARNGALQIEALERMLHTADSRNEALMSESAQRLWQAYSATAVEIANREQLLTGEDGAWADFAARRLGSEPFLSRAFYGHLAQRTENPDLRRHAQLQLTFSLQSAGLDYTALRLMQRSGVDVANLDAQTRYLLGAIAVKRNDAPLASRLWSELPTPANVNVIEWQLTLARTLLQAGDADASVNTIKTLLAGRGPVSPELAQRILELGHETLDLRKLDAAQVFYELVVPMASETAAREALFGLGRTHELKGEPLAASAAYLRSALLLPAASPDARALQARMLAALNLMRAGLRDDARAQFEWLVKNSRDPALAEAARRGLERL